MGDNKMLPLAGGILLFLLLPLVIVIALLLGSMAALGNSCVPSSGGESASFGYPTKDKHDVKAGWDAGDPKHTGIDYDVPAGTPVLAAADGEVVSVEGDTIKIRHDEGAETWYRYFDEKSVRVGDKVKRGDEIGRSGKGNEDEPGATGDHLHFELRVKKDGDQLEPVDPTDQVGEVSEDPASGCGCGGSGGPLVGSNNQQKAFNYFTANGYTPQQAAGIVANMIHESGVEPARLQSTPPGTVTHASDAVGSSSGWGIVQWTPAGKMIQPSFQAGNDDAKVESLEFQLDFLNKQLNGDGPVPEGAAGTAVKAATGVEDAAVAFAQKYERFAGSENLGDPEYGERKATAREVFSTYGGDAAGPGGGCAGNGDIVATAKLLAWDTPGHNSVARGAAKPEYQDALPEYNGSTGDDEYSDCGVFVATVMVMSGVDKDYPRRNTSAQYEYLRNSSKYEQIPNVTNVSQLKPGDIMITDGHTYLFVGEFEGGNGRTYNGYSASLGDHVPQVTTALAGDTRTYSAFRIRN